jgi:HAD superfamily hydrolase (TIGR01450 family)
VKRLGRIKHLALDLDGTLYLGKGLFPFTLEFLQRIGRLRIGRTFFTNNSSVSTAGYVQKLRGLGIDCGADEIYSSTTATLTYLHEKRPEARKLFVLGTAALQQEFVDGGFAVCERENDKRTADLGDEPDAVIVGFDTSLIYARLCRAAYWISRGKPFVATHCDAACPTDEATVLPDCGAICALLTKATGREPDAVLGKPSPAMLRGVLQRQGLAADEIAVVGDRLYTDVAMAQAAGAVSVLVLSGETTRAQAESAKNPPDFVVGNVAELGEMLGAAHGSQT